MAFVLTEEQTLLKDTAEQFFQEQMPVENLRKLRDSSDETGFDRELWKQMADLGFAGILIPEEYGGTDFGPMGIGILMEQAGRTLAASPLVSTVLLSGSIIQTGGSEAQKREILPAIAGGEMIVALALEERAHHAPYAIAATADAADGGFTLKGSKTFVLDGHVADRLIVVARTSGSPGERDGLTLFLVDPSAQGITVTRTVMVDSRNAANVDLAGVAVAADAVIGGIGGGADILDQVLDLGRVGMSAEMLGGVQEVFDRTVEYLKERKQFGVPIGSFQALKHRAAEMFCEIELCRSVVLDALSAIDERRNDVPQLASLAKTKLSETARLVSNEGVQMHGGIGMTDDVDMGLYLKRARVAAATLGDANFHRNRYAVLEGY